ncbi:MAG TPA: hypothetical protein VNS12_11875 [Pelagibacterium sp.]|uniref:hypothetical protein n=1 Tax=Pelagibacterium sp. TaxID=1967288 RepID=UPI002BA01284|nr:hypothetical protein [Pelagibacterium sp.]HWJ88763.1 hypothetical protein [Pelagibacterium sp.]
MNVEPAVRASADTSSYVDWPAILAGAVAAAAVSLVMLTFGSAVGLSMTNPFGREGVSLMWIGIILALWVIWVQVSALMLGGYITGRMRRRHLDSTEHESDVRDGFHGLLVWATAVVFSGLLALGGLSGLAQGAASAVGTAAGAAGPALAQALPDDPFASSIDMLMRGGDPTANDPDATRGEVSRIIVSGVTGDGVTDADRDYLAELVAARTNLSAEEARSRVDQVIATAEDVQQNVADAAKQASRVGVLGAFITAAALAVGAAAAWFCAIAGGNHRDTQTVIPFLSYRRPVR